MAAHGALLDLLARPVASWFAEAFDAPTPAQRLALPILARRENLLLASPTGSGKTLAGFLAVLSDLHELAARGRLEDRTYCVYVSPLKALVSDVARNLEAPLEGIAGILSQAGATPPQIRVAIRTGDTPRPERERQARAPPHLLVTTPESLARLLAAPRARRHLEGVRWLLVDEVHALAESKRGTHLVLLLDLLEELARRAGREIPVRVGWSATVSPMDEVARWLCGERPCHRVDVAPETQRLALDLLMPEPATPGEPAWDEAFLGLLERLVLAHRTTLVFTNTRAAAEALAARLGERIPAEEWPEEDASFDPAFGPPERVAPVATHHGSLSRDERGLVEVRLKRGDLRAVVASSSLELGIHVDQVEHVVLLGSPRSVARLLQRAGRAGHRVEGLSRASLVVTDPGDLGEAIALRELAARRDVEDVRIPGGGLDVLAQHLVGLALVAPWRVEEAWRLARRAHPFRSLPLEDVRHLVGMLEDAGLLDLDPLHDVFSPRSRLAAMRFLALAGTIPATGARRVFHGERYVGEVEEAFAEALHPGDVFQLGAQAWRCVRSGILRLHVEPAPGEAPTLPAWRGEGLALSPRLARVVAALHMHQIPIQNHGNHATQISPSWVAPSGPHEREGKYVSKDLELGTSDPERRFSDFLALQAAHSGVPRPGEVVVESFVEDAGRRAWAFHLPEGRRANEALARAIAHRLGKRLDAPVKPLAADMGFVLLGPRGARLSRRQLAGLFEAPLGPTLREALRGSDLLRRRFRHVCQRALVLRAAQEGVGRAQAEADLLLARLSREAPDHPLLREAWGEVLEDALDAPLAEEARRHVATGEWPLVLRPAQPHASPLAARLLVREGGGATGWARRARLLDLDERVELALALARDQKGP